MAEVFTPVLTFGRWAFGFRSEDSDARTFAAIIRPAASSEIGAFLVNTGQAAGSGNLTYSAEVYDTSGYHVTGSTAELEARLTVPSGVSFVRITGFIEAAGGRIFTSKKNDLTTNEGMPRTGTIGSAPLPAWATYGSAPISVVAGDYFTHIVTAAVTASWFSIEKLPAATKYATVRKTTNQANIVGTQAVTWDAEVADTDGFHDNVTNNSRLTVPSGITRARLIASLKDGTAYSSNVNYFIHKNGASAPGLSRLAGGSFIKEWFALFCGIVPVTAGDYFEVFMTDTDTTGFLEAATATWFSIEDASSAIGALLQKTASQALTAATPAAIAFAGEVYDDVACHSTSVNTSRITVPAGYTKARFSFSVEFDAGANEVSAWVRKNGSGTSAGNGLPGHRTQGPNTDYLCGFGAFVDVVEGDYFELMALSNNAQTIPASDLTWLQVEFSN